ncbi:hypothetical protein H4J58_12570 [Colwellia sp. MB3u-70]|uniref:DUF6701 domain-containing protein n=1 Tax=unclassified Colwellia TaxID=196834 RepID=UPI0015F55F1B|nr:MULTISPECIES: DUF6701 domain-containing protein [unclassified Colwellia]MBA6293384.1 hypothetical protein [Colwellia sp. MB3u-8]MBA6307946.1 hypothetical protein [Colwellia sp. MB3u-70]
MQYFVCLFFCLFSFSASAFADTEYNYDKPSQGDNIFAYKGESTEKVPTRSDFPSTAITNEEYDTLEFDDENYLVSKATKNKNFPSMRSVIVIEQEKSTVTELDILWKGYAENNKNNKNNKKQQRKVILYIWNFESKSYQEIIKSKKPKGDIALTYSFTSDIANYIGGEKKNTIILYAVSQAKNNNGKDSTLYTNFVQVTVVANTEPAIDHYEIVHDGKGLTCAAEPITIKACTDIDCTTESEVSVNFIITDPDTGKVIGEPKKIDTGSKFKFTFTTAETIVLSIDTNHTVQCSGGDASCQMTFSDTGFRFFYGDSHSEIISGQTSGQEFGQQVKLQAVKSKNGVCEGLFSGEVKVSLAQENVTPDLAFNAGLAFQTQGDTIAKYPQFTDEVKLHFGDDSIAIIPRANYFDAGQIRLHANYSKNGITLVGSSNNFWVKPHHFALTAKNSNGALMGHSATSSIKHKAGENFNFTVSALNLAGDLTQNYRQTEGKLQLKVSPVAPSQNGAIDGRFIYASGQSITATPLPQDVTLSSFNAGVKGQSDFSRAQYDEVGIIKIAMQDTNYGGLGKVEGLVSAIDLTVGRFTPAYFKQTVREEEDKGDFDAYPYSVDRGACNFSDWAYTGQRSTDNKGAITDEGAIAYSLQPKVTITAFNANNGITENYTLGKSEGFMKLSASSVDIDIPTHDEIQQVVDSNGDDPVAISAVMHTGSLSASPDNAGELLYTFSDNDHFSYEHNGSSLLAPFTAHIPFVTEQITDTDGIKLAIDPLTNKVAASATEDFVTEGVEIRFARMVLRNSYGSEYAKLRSQVSIEVYDGASFNTHSDESCLTPLIGDKEPGAKYSGNLGLWDYRLIDIEGGDSIEVGSTQASVSDAFYYGMQNQLFFSKPKEQGILEWEYQVPTWLAFKWNSLDANHDGNFYDDNPSATLSFGVYRGNDRIISWHEVFN